MSKNLLIIILVLVCGSVVLAQDDYHKFEVAASYSTKSADGFAGDRFSTAQTGTLQIVGNPDSVKRKYQQGFDGSAVYNFSRYFGVKFAVAADSGKDDKTLLPGNTFNNSGGATIVSLVNTSCSAFQIGFKSKLNSQSYLGGIQFKDNSKEKRFKPFAHFLVGATRQTTKLDEPLATTFFTTTQVNNYANILVSSREFKNNGFTYDLGGGLDIKISNRIDIRVFQFDYNSVKIKEQIVRAKGTSADLSAITGFSATGTAQFDSTIPGRRQNNYRFSFGIVFH